MIGIGTQTIKLCCGDYGFLLVFFMRFFDGFSSSELIDEESKEIRQKIGWKGW